MFSSSEVIRHRERGAPVDCHVLHFGEPEHYLDQCLASLEDAPVNVLILRGGFPGNIGAARAYAVALGHAPYWAFVDADDVLLPGAVSACTAALDGEPSLVGVYTDYEAISPDGALLYRTKKSCWSPLALLNSCWEVLHYHQYRREFVGRHLDGLLAVRAMRRPIWPASCPSTGIFVASICAAIASVKLGSPRGCKTPCSSGAFIETSLPRCFRLTGDGPR